MRISDWSSDVCSSDLLANERMVEAALPAVTHHMHHELVALGDAQRLLLYGAAVGIDVDLGHRSPADCGNRPFDMRRAAPRTALPLSCSGPFGPRGIASGDPDLDRGEDPAPDGRVPRQPTMRNWITSFRLLTVAQSKGI